MDMAKYMSETLEMYTTTMFGGKNRYAIQILYSPLICLKLYQKLDKQTKKDTYQRCTWSYISGRRVNVDDRFKIQNYLDNLET